MGAIPAVSPDALWGASLALLAMLTFGGCMVTVGFTMRHLGSGPGSLLAAAGGVVAGLVSAAALLIVGAGIPPPGWEALLWFAAAGVFSTWLGRWLVFKSIELMGPSRSAALQGLSPMVTALFAWLLLGQALGPLAILGMALGVAGLVGISMGGVPQPMRSQGASHAARQGGWMAGSLLVGLLSAAAYSGSHVMRAAGVQTWAQPLLGAAIGATSGLAALVVASRRQLPEQVREIRAHPVVAGTYLVVGSLQFLSQVLAIASMKYIPAAVASLIVMCTPLVVMPISFFVLRKQENLTPATVLGICITLAGLVLVVLFGRQPP